MISICKASDCNKEIIQTSRTKPKLYCSDRCRDREKARRYRIKRLQNGLCAQCGKGRLTDANTKHCEKCREYYAKRYKRRKSLTNA